MENYPWLYKIGSRGQTLIWRCFPEGAEVVSLSGQEDGKVTESRYIAEAKNVGRSNETTAEEQAVVEVKAHIQAQQENKHYRLSKEEADIVFSSNNIPRKLNNYKDHASKLPEFCYSLVKYNGSRACVVDGNLYSKAGRKEEIKVEHLRNAVAKLHEHGLANFDSEVYAHGLSLQRIRSAWLKPLKTDKEVIKIANDRLKTKDPSITVTDYGSATQVLGYDPNEDANKLCMVIFDLVDLDIDFKARRARLKDVYQEINAIVPDSFLLATAYTTHSEAERLSLRDDVVSAGYEGLVHIAPDDMYCFDRRVYTAQKDKPRYDAEAKVLDVIKDKKGNGTLVVEATDALDNVRFKCVMKVDRRDGKSYPKDYESMLELVGNWITFSYEELSDKGVPTKPVGECPRKCNSKGEPLE